MGDLLDSCLDEAPVPSTCVYHYCSLQAFLSIIENGCLWMTDASKTNDKTEAQWLMSNLNDIINQINQENCNDLDEQALISVRICIDEIIKGYLSNDISKAQYEKTFITCFSEAPDLLSQWRGYGGDGQGVAIGFNPQIFTSFTHGLNYGFLKVIYDTDRTRKFIYQKINELNKNFVAKLGNGKDKTSLTLTEILDIAAPLYSILKKGINFKDPSFQEEIEWRLFWVTNQCNYTNSDGEDDYGYLPAIEGIFAENVKFLESFTRSPLKFRSTDADVRLYMELGFKEHIKKSIIEKIMLGPKCTMTELDLRLLLAKHGYLDEPISNTILIQKSQIPYV